MCVCVMFTPRLPDELGPEEIPREVGTGADTGGGNRERELDEGAEGPATW